MTFCLKVCYPDDTAAVKNNHDAPDSILRRVLREWRGSEQQFRSIKEIVIRLRLVVLSPDIASAKIQQDTVDEILARYTHTKALREQHKRNDMQDMVVVLRLSLLRTVWEKRGFLDLEYIDNVIRQVLRDFKNKHKKKIKTEFWDVVAEMCWDEIKHAQRIEPDTDKDPVDESIDDDDIDEWLKTEL